MAGVGWCQRRLPSEIEDAELESQSRELSAQQRRESPAEAAEYDHHENQILSDSKAMSRAVTRL